ncbi:MAG: hypothetical protein JSW61_00500 [Candidatus Thorarchaeota archaeon]|nr:MAG: hypothetical protein JSW61_00500 [Candidatus Thorarchaeota archaeon]
MRIVTIYGDVFAERVLGNLINFKTFCESCAPTCSDCRVGYGTFVGDIVGMHRVDAPATKMYDNPMEMLEGIDLHECDMIMLVGVHHDLIASADTLVERTDARAVLAPVEDPAWVPPGLREQIKETLEEVGIESAFPKPFCTLDYGHGSLIDEFIDRYRLGLPQFEAEVKNDRIAEITITRSSPCGCAWYVGQKVRGHLVSDTEGLFDVIAKAHHAYPCTGSMTVDRELEDAPLHVAGYNHRYAVCNAIGIECKGEETKHPLAK